ncbi:MAG: hypothetical protein WCO98_10045 [bacterium]
MPKPLKSAGIILSYKCTSRCRHCLYCCSPNWKGWATPELVDAICSGTLKCGVTPRAFHLAGGEAFLNFSLLLESVKIINSYGFSIDYVETNAHWYKDDDSASDMLNQLKEAGLNCLLISASPQHAEYIPVNKTVSLIKLSNKIFGRGGTFIWLPDFLQQLQYLGIQDTISFDEYCTRSGQKHAIYAAEYGGQLVPGGRAGYKTQPWLPTYPLSQCMKDNCEYELMHSENGHYDLYGNIIPSSCTGISLGDAHDLYKWQKEFSIDEKPVLNILCKSGNVGLLEFAIKEYNYQPEDRYAGACHLCMDIRRHLVNSADFTELTPRMMYEEI